MKRGQCLCVSAFSVSLLSQHILNFVRVWGVYNAFIATSQTVSKIFCQLVNALAKKKSEERQLPDNLHIS